MVEGVVVGVELGMREAEGEQLGLVAVPGEAHAEGQVHGVGSAAPPSQKDPGTHNVTAAPVQKEPGGAAHWEDDWERCRMKRKRNMVNQTPILGF